MTLEDLGYVKTNLLGYVLKDRADEAIRIGIIRKIGNTVGFTYKALELYDTSTILRWLSGDIATLHKRTQKATDEFENL